MITSIAFGTVPGSTVQCGSALAVAQTPNWKSCGVGWKPRAWSALKPSWPVRTTVKPQPGPGVPSDAFGTRKVMKREIGLALIATVPSVVPGGVLVALAEALHLDQPAPRERRRDLEVARRVRGGGRGRSTAPGIVHVDVDELRAERAAEGRRQVARLHAEDHVRCRRRRPGTPGCRRRPAWKLPEVG